MLLLKNLQFLPNDYETWSKLSTHGYLILREFHNHWVKIVDFLLKACVLQGVSAKSSHLDKQYQRFVIEAKWLHNWSYERKFCGLSEYVRL